MRNEPCDYADDGFFACGHAQFIFKGTLTDCFARFIGKAVVFGDVLVGGGVVNCLGYAV